MAAHVAELARGSGSTWRDLRIDSLDLLDLVVRCEEATGTALPDAIVAGLRGPADLVAHLHARGSEGAASSEGTASSEGIASEDVA